MRLYSLVVLFILFYGIFAYRSYDLTQDAPSYAFHSNRLKENGPIWVNGCANCTLFIDASVWRYQGLVPFFMNGSMPDLRNCTQDLGSDPKGQLYLCSYQVKQTVYFQYNAQASNGIEFAVSVRVKEYMPGSTSYTLYPVYQNSSLIVGSFGSVTPSMVTIVARMPTNPITLLSFIGVVQDNCAISVLAGSSPGKVLNSENVLDTIKKGDRFLQSIIRSSVFTIYAPTGCRTDIQFGDRDMSRTTLDDLRANGRAIITSFEFPWQFDETTNYTTAFSGEYRMEDNSTAVNISLSIWEITGGMLNVNTLNFDPNGRMLNNNTFGSGDMKNGNYSGPMGQVVQYQWTPHQNATRKGFRLWLLTDQPWNYTNTTTVLPTKQSSTTVIFGNSTINSTLRGPIQSTTPKSSENRKIMTTFLIYLFGKVLFNWCQ